MRNQGSILVLLAAALAAAPAAAQDGVVGVFFDRTGQECSGTVSNSGLTTLHVLLVPQGATYRGINGAELRVSTDSSDLLLMGETPVAQIHLGHAIAEGATLGFSTCQTGNPILLFTFQVLATGAARDAEIRVTAKLTPGNPNFPCPLAVLCDGPVFSEVCVSGGKAIANPTQPRPCGSSRESSEWTRVKAFYR